MMEQINNFKQKLDKTIVSLKEDFNTVRAGRANPHVLDKLTVDYYGAPTPIAQVGNITIPEARILQIQPWDSSLLKQIEKTINEADININPSNDGKVIRLIFPELTEDRRKELTKEVKKKGENAKVAVRNLRRDVMDELKKLEKSHQISEDELSRHEAEVQKITDKFVAEIDKNIEAKNKEILSV
ncbi:ribosome recycling factor [Candidatus Epulonipiscium fishelsonii]|uniref:Ribosome recycling factor n=1 Tax=Candidatus Epulonipiscium fishelsonii TaxID=77094 RepID=A0ACC8XDQ3_9FIRM|nr:ribosome recycling factor [Epulopiscium sp. SCG-B05WGA-EpuloA1]ONI41013.1 ribosome recycling factor [Epulopiscium sp. SCG-B11WGA-EpuloA1]ONI47411.1 ribosome recycling factor [Epulopiscium sp. SCG-C06WGA-EpuloA1]